MVNHVYITPEDGSIPVDFSRAELEAGDRRTLEAVVQGLNDSQTGWDAGIAFEVDGFDRPYNFNGDNFDADGDELSRADSQRIDRQIERDLGIYGITVHEGVWRVEGARAPAADPLDVGVAPPPVPDPADPYARAPLPVPPADPGDNGGTRGKVRAVMQVAGQLTDVVKEVYSQVNDRFPRATSVATTLASGVGAYAGVKVAAGIAGALVSLPAWGATAATVGGAVGAGLTIKYVGNKLIENETARKVTTSIGGALAGYLAGTTLVDLVAELPFTDVVGKIVQGTSLQQVAGIAGAVVGGGLSSKIKELYNSAKDTFDDKVGVLTLLSGLAAGGFGYTAGSVFAGGTAAALTAAGSTAMAGLVTAVSPVIAVGAGTGLAMYAIQKVSKDFIKAEGNRKIVRGIGNGIAMAAGVGLGIDALAGVPYVGPVFEAMKGAPQVIASIAAGVYGSGLIDKIKEKYGAIAQKDDKFAIRTLIGTGATGGLAYLVASAFNPALGLVGAGVAGSIAISKFGNDFIKNPRTKNIVTTFGKAAGGALAGYCGLEAIASFADVGWLTELASTNLAKIGGAVGLGAAFAGGPDKLDQARVDLMANIPFYDSLRNAKVIGNVVRFAEEGVKAGAKLGLGYLAGGVFIPELASVFTEVPMWLPEVSKYVGLGAGWLWANKGINEAQETGVIGKPSRFLLKAGLTAGTFGLFADKFVINGGVDLAKEWYTVPFTKGTELIRQFPLASAVPAGLLHGTLDAVKNRD